MSQLLLLRPFLSFNLVAYRLVQQWRVSMIRHSTFPKLCAVHKESGVSEISLLLGALGAAFLAGAIRAAPLDDFTRGNLEYSRGDVVAAMDSYRKAADAGYAPAQVRLAYIYDKSEQNEEAVKWYRRAAEQGDADGQYQLGEMYSTGEGVAQDFAQATAWIQKAAAQNQAAAIKVLAKRYELGTHGLPKDQSQALHWWQRAAYQGDDEAIVRMAKAYRVGELGLTADGEKASFWEQRRRVAAPGDKVSR